MSDAFDLTPDVDIAPRRGRARSPRVARRTDITAIPYYDDGGITLYHGDCRDVLPFVTADVAITDPPYNVGIEYGSSDRTADRRSDYLLWCASWFAALRTAAPSIALTPGVVNVATWCRFAEPDWILAWHKPAAMGRSPFGFCNWEPILFYGQPRTGRGTDVITAPIVTDRALDGHPCPKPERWAIGLINLLSDPSDVVIDPFAGSGTTLVAARRLGRRAIGIEREERFCEMTAERLAQGGLDLFDRDDR